MIPAIITKPIRSHVFTHMKKPIKILSFISAMLMAVGLTACSQDEICVPDNGHQAQALNPFSRSIDQAIDIAESSMAMLYPETGSRATARKVSKENVVVIKASSSRSGDEDKLIYAVNFDDNQGYVLVAAPRCKDDVLAVVPKGTFDEAAAESTPGVDMFLSAAKQYVTIKDSKGNLTFPDSVEGNPRFIHNGYLAPPRTDTLMYYHQNPQVSVEWGQMEPYGTYCPNLYSGCAATAIATIAAFQGFQKGDNRTIYYTYKGRDMDSQYVDWAEVYRHKKNGWREDGIDIPEICYAENKYESHRTISRLCRQIGEDGHADYTNYWGTGMYEEDFIRVLKKYVPSCMTVTEPMQFHSFQISPYLDRGILMVYGMTDYNMGHVWVADGYDILKAHVVYTKQFEDGNWGYDERIDHRVLTHMRWGWDGEYDGYYNGSVFLPRGSQEIYRDVKFVASYIPK